MKVGGQNGYELSGSTFGFTDKTDSATWPIVMKGKSTSSVFHTAFRQRLDVLIFITVYMVGFRFGEKPDPASPAHGF